jgi:hypothetical protein
MIVGPRRSVLHFDGLLRAVVLARVALDALGFVHPGLAVDHFDAVGRTFGLARAATIALGLIYDCGHGKLLEWEQPHLKIIGQKSPQMGLRRFVAGDFG